MEKLDGKTLDLTKENINSLKQLFPEVVTEGKIDFDKLKLVLGEEIESNKERYELTWHGKARSLKLAQTPSTGTLRPVKESSKNWDTTENLYIEGDNLEVLKLLQKSYFGKVKMIYIDPPYNTGNDFVYKDNFSDNVKNYLLNTEQNTRTNTESNGRFHTDWLNMLYPRLKIARNLLQDDGAIFISIDDEEVDNLKKVCIEIFGEENFMGVFIWKSRQNVDSRNKTGLSTDHEYIAVFCKNREVFKLKGKPIDKSKYSNPDNDPRGPWMSNSILGLANSSQRPNLHYLVKDPLTGREFDCPEDTGWRFSKETMQSKINEGRIIFPKNDDGRPREKKYLLELDSTFTGISSILTEEVGFTLNGSREVRSLMGGKYFDFPKPVSLIKSILKQADQQDAVILDFFSGSATTAHAVMQLNAEDQGKRKFIMVQLPELTDEKSEAYKVGYKNICEIAIERIRRAGDKIVEETGKTDIDTGYKVFKLDSSNVKLWDPDSENLEQDLFDLQDNIKEDRSKEDLLFEVLLKIGVQLTTPIGEVNVNGKVIYNVGFGAVLLCLEDEINLEVVNELIKLKPEDFESKVIFKETGFLDDSVKTNAIQTLKKNGITDVRSV